MQLTIIVALSSNELQFVAMGSPNRAQTDPKSKVHASLGGGVGEREVGSKPLGWWSGRGRWGKNRSVGGRAAPVSYQIHPCSERLIASATFFRASAWTMIQPQPCLALPSFMHGILAAIRLPSSSVAFGSSAARLASRCAYNRLEPRPCNSPPWSCQCQPLLLQLLPLFDVLEGC